METVDFAGNDYLGLARDPRLAEALSRTAREHGISATSSRWALGWTDIHQQLEEELADFFGAQAACIMGAAYFGGMAYFAVLGKSCSAVYCDETSHSNLFFGMRAAGFDIHTFKHLDGNECRALVEKDDPVASVIATDGVYGISGEIAPLGQLKQTAAVAGAHLFIDDAHGVFVLGDRGRGSSELHGVDGNDAVILGSLSKALGCNGGFLVGDETRVEQFRHAEGPSGSAIPPAPIAAASLKALSIVRAEPELRARMWRNARRMRDALRRRRIDVVSGQTPIIAMNFADEFEAAAAAEHFLSQGLRIPYFKYASEPRENMLRAAARACYTEDQLQRFEAAVDSLKLGG